MVVTVKDKSKHRTTDPACYKHKTPRGPLGRWLFNRGRGKGCVPCMVYRAWGTITPGCICGHRASQHLSQRTCMWSDPSGPTWCPCTGYVPRPAS